MQFSLIIDGPNAPAPAPRCNAVPAHCAGVWDSERREIWRPDYESFRAALPARLRRYCPAMPSLWYDARCRIDGDGRTVPDLPYLTLRNARGRYVATVYCALMRE